MNFHDGRAIAGSIHLSFIIYHNAVLGPNRVLIRQNSCPPTLSAIAKFTIDQRGYTKSRSVKEKKLYVGQFGSFSLVGQAKLSDLPLRPLMDVSRVGESERGRAPLPDVADNAVLSSGTYQLQKAAHAVQLARSQPIKGHRTL